MRIVLYARLYGRTGNRRSLSGCPNSKLRQWAQLLGHEVIAEITEAESAKSVDKRQGLQGALQTLREGFADGIVIAKLDRLTRSIADWQRLISEFFNETSGKQLFSLADSIDTTPAGGRLVLNVLLSVAQWEREAISERTKTALQFKIANNERVGEIRYGYSLAADGKTLIPDEFEQSVIRMIQSQRAEGKSYRCIANYLNENGIVSKKGKPWRHTTVASILKRLA